MAIVMCPWCQSEISQEEGQEPDKICPVCDNELDGYRTLKLNIGDSDVEDDEVEVEDDDEDEDSALVSITETEDMSWDEDNSIVDTNDELLQFEETVEQLLNEQELMPECPLCHEYMIESGEQLLSTHQFRPRVADIMGEAVIEAPFTLTMYICPTCFSVHSFLGDAHRHQVVRRLSQDYSGGKGKGNGV
jgi:Zn finger protein HypA/HybF involved in hydrogenase expression